MKKYPARPPKDIRHIADYLNSHDDDFIFLYDKKGKILWCNRQVLKVLRITWAKITSMKIQKVVFIGPETPARDTGDGYFKKHRLAGARINSGNFQKNRSPSTEEGPISVRNLDSDPFGLPMRAIVVPLKSGNILMLTKVYYATLEKELANYSKDCLVLLDSNERILGYNQRFREVVTGNPESLTGQPIWKYICRHDWDNYSNKIKDAEKQMREISRLAGEPWSTVFHDDFQRISDSKKKWAFDRVNRWEIKSRRLTARLRIPFGFALVTSEIPQLYKDIKINLEFEFSRAKGQGHIGVFLSGIYHVVESDDSRTPDTHGYLVAVTKNGEIRVKRETQIVFQKKITPLPYNKRFRITIAKIGGLIRIYVNDHLLGEYNDIEMILSDRLNFCGLCAGDGVKIYSVRMETRPSVLNASNLPRLNSDLRFNNDMHEIYMPKICKNYQNIRGIDAYLLTRVTQQRAAQLKLEEHMTLLQKINSRLEVAINDKQDFMRAISHDLSAPLRNIRGMLELLKNEAGPELLSSCEPRLKRIAANVQRGEELIGDIMSLSRIKTNRFPFEVVDINGVIKDTLQEFVYDLEKKGIDVHVPREKIKLLCEKPMMAHIFRNLLDNAIKYIGDNNPKPEICIEYLEEEERHLFNVRDNGIGIKKEDQVRIFFAFRRIQSERTKNVPGKGLGLSIVRTILENYEGNIWVQSSENRGSTFYFTMSKSSTKIGKTDEKYSEKKAAV
jgi:signal transduction histidine kinase